MANGKKIEQLVVVPGRVVVVDTPTLRLRSAIAPTDAEKAHLTREVVQAVNAWNYETMFSDESV